MWEIYADGKNCTECSQNPKIPQHGKQKFTKIFLGKHTTCKLLPSALIPSTKICKFYATDNVQVKYISIMQTQATKKKSGGPVPDRSILHTAPGCQHYKHLCSFQQRILHSSHSICTSNAHSSSHTSASFPPTTFSCLCPRHSVTP